MYSADTVSITVSVFSRWGNGHTPPLQDGYPLMWMCMKPTAHLGQVNLCKKQASFIT